MSLTCFYVSNIATRFDKENLPDITVMEVNILSSLIYVPFLLSLYSVAMLALVRFKVVAYPLTISKLKSSKFLIILYIITMAISIIFLLAIPLVSLEAFQETFNFNENLIYILHPAILLTIAVLFILHTLKVRRIRQSFSARTYNIKSSIRRMNITIYIIMCLFIICESPLVICDVLGFLKRKGIDVKFSDHSEFVSVSVGIVFYMMNHAVNPFIYFISYYCFQRMRTSRQTMEDRQTSESTSHM